MPNESTQTSQSSAPYPISSIIIKVIHHNKKRFTFVLPEDYQNPPDSAQAFAISNPLDPSQPSLFPSSSLSPPSSSRQTIADQFYGSYDRLWMLAKEDLGLTDQQHCLSYSTLGREHRMVITSDRHLKALVGAHARVTDTSLMLVVGERERLMQEEETGSFWG